MVIQRETERERERETESIKMGFELLLSNNTFNLFYRSYKKCDGWSVKNVLFIKIKTSKKMKPESVASDSSTIIRALNIDDKRFRRFRYSRDRNV